MSSGRPFEIVTSSLPSVIDVNETNTTFRPVNGGNDRNKARHYSLTNEHIGVCRDPLSVRLASTYRSARCNYGRNFLDVKEDSTAEHVEIDAGEPPPVDESLFFDNLEALRDAKINGTSLKSAMWSVISAGEMKLLLDMEKGSLNGGTNGRLLISCNARFKNIAYIWACFRGLPHLLPRLEICGANIDYVEPCTGVNAILAASLSGNVACLKYLIGKGADVNYTSSTNHYTPLHFAAFGNSRDAAKLLVDCGGKIESTIDGCQEIEPVLHCAIRSRSVEVVKLLLENGASVVQKNHQGETPLHVACFVQSSVCVDLLLGDPGVDVNAADRSHRTPLHFTVMNTNSSPELVELLLKNGANVNASDKAGFTPLHIAALNEQSHCVDTLIWAGADVSATTSAGLSALNVILRKIPESLEVSETSL